MFLSIWYDIRIIPTIHQWFHNMIFFQYGFLIDEFGENRYYQFTSQLNRASG